MQKPRCFLMVAILALQSAGSVGAADPSAGLTTGGGSSEITPPALSTQRAHNVTNEFFVGGRLHLEMSILPASASQYAKPPVKTVSILSLPNNTTYTGDVFEDVPNGWGILTQPTGTRLEGDWRYGNPNQAHGKMVFPEGVVEDGSWDYRLGTGIGTIRWPDGTLYKGTWKNISDSPDQPEGTGTMTWPDGRTYVGQFTSGQLDGRGRMTYPDGKVVDGLWEKGDLRSSKTVR